jgi:hypothetical protein
MLERAGPQAVACGVVLGQQRGLRDNLRGGRE